MERIAEIKRQLEELGLEVSSDSKHPFLVNFPTSQWGHEYSLAIPYLDRIVNIGIDDEIDVNLVKDEVLKLSKALALLAEAIYL